MKYPSNRNFGEILFTLLTLNLRNFLILGIFFHFQAFCLPQSQHSFLSSDMKNMDNSVGPLRTKHFVVEARSISEDSHIMSSQPTVPFDVPYLFSVAIFHIDNLDVPVWNGMFLY